jgi:molybdenum cofactor biosynthesis enzyme
MVALSIAACGVADMVKNVDKGIYITGCTTPK